MSPRHFGQGNVASRISSGVCGSGTPSSRSAPSGSRGFVRRLHGTTRHPPRPCGPPSLSARPRVDTHLRGSYNEDAPNALGDRLAVGRRALDPLAGVRILLPQPFRTFVCSSLLSRFEELRVLQDGMHSRVALGFHLGFHWFESHQTPMVSPNRLSSRSLMSSQRQACRNRSASQVTETRPGTWSAAHSASGPRSWYQSAAMANVFDPEPGNA